MARQKCLGIVDDEPYCRRFSPEGKAATGLARLSLEEFEAIRLKDRVGLDQVECAAAMGLTRPTFQRILRSARYKMATAIAEGHGIIIEGGNFLMRNRVFECMDCGERWEEAPCQAGGRHGHEIACPKCGGLKKVKIENGMRHECAGGHGHRHGGCCGGR